MFNKLVRIVSFFFVVAYAAGFANAVENLSVYSGTDVRQVLNKIGEPDHVANNGDGLKVYVWQQTRTAYDYAGENKPGGLVRVGQTECVVQMLVSQNGKIVRAVIDGEVLACATLKKKMGLL